MTRSPSPNPFIAIIEDNDHKYSDIIEVLSGVTKAMPHRASNARDAERLLEKFPADLLILDISMGISRGSITKARQGFANLGGLDILDTLYYIGRSVPTIIVTGFDIFESDARRSSGYDVIGLSQISDIAATRLGDDFLGCVRYESEGWQMMLHNLLLRWSAP